METKSTKTTPKLFEYELVNKAKMQKRHIVLPEGLEDRILKAAESLIARDIVDITLLGNETEIKSKIQELGLDIKNVNIIDPANSPLTEKYIETFYELRKSKGITLDDAKKLIVNDLSYFGTMMIHMGDADGMVSGAVHSTAETIRPGLQIIKTKPGVSIVSSVFLMCLADKVYVYGDCAVNPNPNAEELANIAVTSAETGKIFGVEPRVALLSYSTGNSGTGPDVDLVKEATAIAKKMKPDMKIDGPLQYDAAVSESVAKTKLPNSEVAGKATIFVFPNLSAGNIGYKAVQRETGAIAIGPILQGLNKPVNDLSRGCTVPDIINTVIITAIQSQK
jgi:phosphate acetyltransferase